MVFLIEILRQRIFLDHNSKAKTFITEEFTLRSIGDGVDNIFIEMDHFLPNLHILDSDGEELPLVTNDITLNLLESKKDDEIDVKIKKKYQDYIARIRDQTLYFLWIKLPPSKKMQKNQFRVITLEYDAIKNNKPSRKIEIDYNRVSSHSVFYIIKKPEDYEFNNKPHISFTDNNGEFKIFDEWDVKPGNSIYVTEIHNSISITIIPERTKTVYVSYSFSPNKNIISFPLLAVGLLGLVGIILVILNHCDFFNTCFLLTNTSASTLLSNKVEIAIGVVAASLILPGLIKNDFIRNEYKYYFLLPMGIAFFAFF